MEATSEQLLFQDLLLINEKHSVKGPGNEVAVIGTTGYSKTQQFLRSISMISTPIIAILPPPPSLNSLPRLFSLSGTLASILFS